MTNDEIIRMARESGVFEVSYPHPGNIAELERFAALVAASEREACAEKTFELEHALRAAPTKQEQDWDEIEALRESLR